VPKTDTTLLERAKTMRSNPTPAEYAVWNLLRAKRFARFKFSRQVVIEPYIIDFVARTQRLAIELDGHGHGETEVYDDRRTRFLELKGYRVIRFTNNEVTSNIEGVAEIVAAALRTAPLPSPLPGGEREL